MYKRPTAFNTLVRNLVEQTGRDTSDVRQFVYVEITLYLAECLKLDAEPLNLGWVLLSKMPLSHPLLNNLAPEQRRMLANAAIIVPLSSRYAWEGALSHYKKIPLEHRLYEFSEKPYAEQLINLCRQEPCRDPQRLNIYEEILRSTLEFAEREQRFAEVEKTYRVAFRMQNGNPAFGRVKITLEMVKKFDKRSGDWFSEPRVPQPLEIRIQDLYPIAEFLDEYEQRTGGRTHWVRDWKQIRYRRASYLDNKLALGDENADALHFQGAVHLPGMVSAGKTTLAKLIIAYCIYYQLDIRITLVVGDSHTAIQIAHQVNSWFCDSPEGDDVVAVPILGTTQREEHLRRLFESREYTDALKKGQPHWGERWLMPVCGLASQVQWDNESNVDVRAGGEPCYRLTGKLGKSRKSKSHICPLIHNCPSMQLYRDMPKARLWVTTPGAFAQASLPKYLDARYGNMGDVIYERSDLVILDEVETIVDWFDKTYATKEALTNGDNGLLDRLDVQISSFWRTTRVLDVHHRHWVITARETLKPVSSVLTAITNPARDRDNPIKRWVKRGFFAPNGLAYRLARRIAGLKEWDDDSTSESERLDNERKTLDAFEPFNVLLNGVRDRLRSQIHLTGYTRAQVEELITIIQAINTPTDEFTDLEIRAMCRDWILKWHNDMENRLARLKKQLLESTNPYDQIYLNEHFDKSVGELARRLQFMLTVALLDRHTHIVIEEWHNKPEALQAEQPFGRIPQGMRNILPLPLTGRQYGFVADTSKNNDNAANVLSVFSYTNIGRSYILNFHRLREDLEERTGPNVLALSGTSYLPDSTAFHVTIPPAGILMASPETEAAIRDSRFIWRCFNDEDGKPIAVSGVRDKENQMEHLMLAMLRDGGVPGGFLGKVLGELETLAKEKPEQWDDRERILLLTNSYSQAKKAAQVLREKWSACAESIYNLKQGSKRDTEDYVMETERNGELKRMDIEQFAQQDGGKILIAPMQSIGRGFNILNNSPEPKAAFGAVLFLTRPMNQPNDMEAVAQEINRYSLEWAQDRAFVAWAEDTLYKRAIKARDKANELRRKIESRYAYSLLQDDAELRVYPRRDLAATTAGRIIQAVGRLLRGAVPFRAYFIDAAWSPELAKTNDPHSSESEETSLLTALIDVIAEYAHRDEVGYQLYGGFSDALTCTENRDSN